MTLDEGYFSAQIGAYWDTAAGQAPVDIARGMSELNDPRVLFAAERTLMAWSRTAAGLRSDVTYASFPVIG